MRRRLAVMTLLFMLMMTGCPVVPPPGHPPGHDPFGPGNSENAPGHNKTQIPPGQMKK